MDISHQDLETQCENMMFTVVETRKDFKKRCVHYEQNTSILENKIMNYNTAMFAKYKLKPKYNVPVYAQEDIDDLDKFSTEMTNRTKRIEDLKRTIKNAQTVVAQLKADGLGKRLREPLTVENLLAKAEGKKV